VRKIRLAKAEIIEKCLQSRFWLSALSALAVSYEYPVVFLSERSFAKLIKNT
jgi:hypothetical protein